MSAFRDEPQPVAKPDQVVKLEPAEMWDNPLREVRSVEQLGEHPRHDFGSIAANDTATENNDDEIEMTELEMKQGEIGQWRVDILSPVEVEVAQEGKQATRFESANNVGRLTPDQPVTQRRVFVVDNDAPHFTVHNPRSDARAAAYVAFPGEFKLLYREIDRGDVGNRQPISIPVARLELQTQQTVSEVAQSQAGSGRTVVDRHGRGGDD